MTNICQYVCDNKTEYGYCRTTVCINPKYNQQTVKAWLSKADYVQVVRCGECAYFMHDDLSRPLYSIQPCIPNRREDDYCSRGVRMEETDA